MDRVDARKLTAEGRRLLRQMVVRLRKQSGMTCAQLAAVAGVHVRTIEVWLKRARNEGEGSLGEKRRGRPLGFGRWLKGTYPALLARAKAEGALIYWGDETAVKEDAKWIRGYAPKRKTPVLATPARWRKLSMISAISPRGEIVFRIVEGSLDTDRFLEFLGALIEGAQRKIFLVVDNLRVHHAKRVSEWLVDKTERIELVFLPPYAPESNPDEYLNRDFKTALRTGAVSRDACQLMAKATAFMQRLCAMPDRVRAYFRHPCAAYAAQGAGLIIRRRFGPKFTTRTGQGPPTFQHPS